MLRKALWMLIIIEIGVFTSGPAMTKDSDKEAQTVTIPDYPKPFPAQLLAQNQPPRDLIIIAHRGANKFAPANTLPAIAAAIAMGMDFAELDVRTTKDNHLVIMHNATVEATTDGVGTIREMTLEQIKTLDAGVKFGPEFKGVKVPTFEEALALMEGKIGLYLDAKDVDPKAAAELLIKYNMVERTVVYCDYISAKAWNKAAKGIRPMPEVDNVQGLQLALRAVPDLKVVAGNWDNVTPEIVKAIHDKGLKWFVDIQGGESPERVVQALDVGLDGVQTDNPDMVLGVVRRLAEKKPQQ